MDNFTRLLWKHVSTDLFLWKHLSTDIFPVLYLLQVKYF